jgi:hypothetical protein
MHQQEHLAPSDRAQVLRLCALSVSVCLLRIEATVLRRLIMQRC